MSAAKHTPGPWQTDRNNVHSAQIATIHQCVGNDWIEVWSPKALGASEEMQEANARLISAAPELLEALRGIYAAYCGVMRDQFDFPGRPWTPERDNDTVALQARAAIVKATGSAS